MTDSYETHAKGIRILPGQWRPHYAYEQIAWISPPWPSQDYIWLDFPEAVFADQGHLFLSAWNPVHPVLFPDMPKVPWQDVPGGMAFERELPNGVSFGGSLVREGDAKVAMELHINNGSETALTNIKIQTCAYCRGIKEFADFHNKNKFVHTAGTGWITLAEALDSGEREGGRFGIGWRGGTLVPDLPSMVCTSNQAERLVAITGGEDTCSLIGT
ncbi:MAG: hypothetical protein QF662_09330, partial [Phycisphaerae bacterium]|nr:hypothetical protein [Phycisphaerae bacterium]